ncbi:MAG: AAA family ATPase [Steroidobacteraceae bacterium]
MYTAFFGLTEKPFAITPDPRYLFMSERHAEALAHLLYGINEAGGFIQLTGEVGTGKTTVVRSLLERMPKHAEVAVILNPQLKPVEFLLTICEELGIFVRDTDVDSAKELVDVLNKRLLEAHAKGRRVVLIVDEAQNLSPETLEQVRLLTNLETASHKLLQIILIGQPELREVLGRNELRQLAQRITGRYHLNPLSRVESAAYVRHRLKVAGANFEIFTPTALREIHRLSGGIPRIINVICDRALLGGYTQETQRIGPPLVRAAAGEVYGKSISPAWMRPLYAAAAIIGVIVLCGGLWLLFGSDPAPVAAASKAPIDAGAPPAATQLAAATESPPEPEPAVDTGRTPIDVTELLNTQAQFTNTTAAFSQLFALWGAHFDPNAGRACDQALAQGLECVFQKGSWGQLRTLNRPAILTLIDDTGSAHQLTIAQLKDDAAQVTLGSSTHDVSVGSLSRYWDGEYLLLWRPQVTGLRALRIGMRGDEVRWLRRSLYSAQGQKPAEPTSDYYDDELASMVEEFQRRHRLNVDGVAGVHTQIVLDMVVNAPGAPLLDEGVTKS